VKIAITPSQESELPPWPVQEIAVVNQSFDVAAEVDQMLKLRFQARLPKDKTQ
jgi:hypothetical protein